jgi:hypothetical protein
MKASRSERTLFIAADDTRVGLEAVARDVFAAFGLEEHEERFSSNYPPNDHYFAGYGENVVLHVFDFDAIRPGFIYGLSLSEPTHRSGTQRAPADAATAAEILARAGFRVFVPIGAWSRPEWDGRGSEYVP